MTSPLSYRDALPAHRRSAPACAPRPQPEPGAVLFTSTGAYDVTDRGAVRRTKASEITTAVETHDPEVLGCPMPAWCAGLLVGVLVCSAILYLLGVI